MYYIIICLRSVRTICIFDKIKFCFIFNLLFVSILCNLYKYKLHVIETGVGLVEISSHLSKAFGYGGDKFIVN